MNNLDQPTSPPQPQFPVDTSDLRLTDARKDPPKKKPDVAKVILISLGSLIALFVLVGACGAILGGEPTLNSTPLAAPASSETFEPTEDAVTEDPTESIVGSEGNIEKSDIKLHIKQLSQKCYGSAGCNVEYRVVVDGAYMDGWPDSGEVEVSYKVTGPEDGPETDTFIITLDDGQYEKPWEESTSTRSRSVKLTVKVTDLEYNSE